jgi:hypothetical protein
MFILFCIVMLVMLEEARRSRRATLALEYQYKLFELRDELREYVIANPGLTKSWVFLFLDSTITKMAGILPKMSLWKLAGLLLTYRHSDRMRHLHTHLEREYRKPDHAKFAQVELKLMALLDNYITKKHFSVVAMLNFPILKALRKLPAYRLRKESLVVAVEGPETSTLGQHCPA